VIVDEGIARMRGELGQLFSGSKSVISDLTGQCGSLSIGSALAVAELSKSEIYIFRHGFKHHKQSQL
jgi:hypothetical protein